MTTPTPAEAHAMGRTGANLPPEVLEAERLAFEAWKNHRLTGLLKGLGLDRSQEPGKHDDYADPFTQMQWIAWRDRAALAHHAAGGEAGQ